MIRMRRGCDVREGSRREVEAGEERGGVVEGEATAVDHGVGGGGVVEGREGLR